MSTGLAPQLGFSREVIAVKLLHDDPVQIVDDRHFSNEVFNLLRVEHPNIIQLRGYCYETRYKYVEHNGENVFGKHIYRVLCFEYLQGGSLDNHLHAPSLAPNWTTRYNIIKGICEGLNFLHECEPPILHLDLKPANILLDSSMVPKLADFGLSRLFRGSHTHVTKQIRGTQKYVPPEFIREGKISVKNDVFSLGIVIIEIMAGPTGYSDFTEMGSITQFVEEVLSNWCTMIKATSKYPEEDLHQVNTCINTAIHCVDSERVNRPTIAGILDALNRTETHIPSTKKTHIPSSAKRAHIPQEQSADVLCPRIVPKTMTAEVDYITNKQQHFSCMPRDSFSINFPQVPDKETSSEVEQTLIIGRTGEKHNILSILSENMTEEMIILPIYGIAGIGKTTLAQLVFNDPHFNEYSRVWVYVSQKFDLKKIGNSIISQLTKDTSHIAEKQTLHNCLGELFSGKSTLIVLDDLWEEKQHELENLKAMLMPRLGSKVVIVTTRDEAIARKISRTVMPYKLEILTDDMCWTIIKQKSSFEDLHDKDQLEQTGRDIAIKCGGVALAAQSLGYMLRDMTSDQWESVRDSYIWSLSTTEGPSLRNHEVLASLLLSYSHMHEYLQLCFSYCAMFRKGQNIVKYDLIHQWIALGFTEQSSTFDSMQICEKYITQLLGMSFLQHSKTRHSSDKQQDKDVILFTMHDLVHDLATVILADKVSRKGSVVGSSCHYALLTDCSKPLKLSPSSLENTRFKYIFNLFQKRSSLENIKALFFLDCGKIELRGGAFSQAKCLLVLDLSGCFIRKLPDSIGQLKQLKYLHAPRIKGQRIPCCITELSELNYLNLRGSSKISALPKSIGDMKGLMHLDLSGCMSIRKLPMSFAELKQLVHLDLSDCLVSISENFGGFTKLQYLNLSIIYYRDVMHRGGLSEVIGNLNKLKYLNLSQCMNAIASSEDQTDSLLDSISTLTNLEHLDLSNNRELSSIPESIGNLRKLHTLDVSRCGNLTKLPGSMVNMVSLKVLNVERGVTFDKYGLSLLNIASLPHFVVHASSHKRSSNILCLQPTNPVELTIDRLENVKSAEEAGCIKLIEKQKIEKLKFQWTVAAGRIVDDKEVLEKLMPPCSVQIFYIDGYSSASFPDWLMGIRHYLPNLLEIYLCGFPNCNNLPPLGELPNLEKLSLCRMKGLEEWSTAYTSGKEFTNKLLFPKLKRLRIEHCAKLRIKPCIIKHLSSLKLLDLRLGHDGKAALRDYTSIRSWKAELPSWLFELPSLQKLIISHSELELRDGNISKLTQLQELSLSKCTNMTSLPQWLGELASLKKLEIKDCEVISSLPNSIQQLNKLERLSIYECPKLVEWCRSEDNKMKLAHIREKVSDGRIF